MNGIESTQAVPDGKQCPQCGAPLPPGVLAGLCPACLLKQGAAADTATQPPAPPFQPPPVAELARLFPQLEILGLLGKGGMGAVYKARQPALERLVALKILPIQAASDAAFGERFTREARALARLSHPNIVALHEFGQANGLNYFIMELVDGVNLRQLQKTGRLSPREALQIVPQICDALQYAHDEGVVHRDIKPENVLVDRKGRVKIADFGLAKILGRDAQDLKLTSEGQVMGTPHYMAPEQVEHPLEVDHRADIFSLGVVFYEMLTGELPLGKFAPPSRRVQVDVRLDEVVLHALEKQPEHRYQHVSEVKSAVETIAHGQGPVSRPVAASPGWEAARRRVRAPATALMVLGLLGLALPVLVPIRGSEPGLLHFSLLGFGYYRVPMPEFLAQTLVWTSSLMPVLYLVAIIGAFRMRRLQDFTLAIAGAAAATVALPLLPLGLPLGLWALRVVTFKEVREQFGSAAVVYPAPDPGSGPEISRLAVLGGGLAVIPMVAQSLLQSLGVLGGITTHSGWISLVYSAVWGVQGWAGLGAVLLCWIALEDIRRANGKLKSAGLAIFGILFFPFGWGLWQITRSTAGWEQNTPTENLAYWLTEDLLALSVCGALALWAHKQEERWLRSGPAFAAQPWWLISQPGAWLARTLAGGAICLSFAVAFHHLGIQNEQSGSLELKAFAARLDNQGGLALENANHEFSLPMSGGSVRLLALSDLSTKPMISWSPDGAELSKVAGTRAESNPATTRSLVLTVQLPASPKPMPGDDPRRRMNRRDPVKDVGLFDGMPNLPFELRLAGKLVGSSSLSFSDDREFILFPAARDANSLDLRVGAPVGEWQETFVGWEWSGKLPRHPERAILHGGQQAEVSLSQVWEMVQSGCVVSWFSRSFPADWVGRIVAVDDSGAIHIPDGNIVNKTTLQDAMIRSGLRGESVSFKGLVSSHIKELRFQIRQCRWVEARNISLQPGRRTEVELVPAETPVGNSASKVSAQTWSTALEPGQQPEPDEILQEAQEMCAKGKHEEALQRYLWHQRFVRKFDPSASFESSMSGWIELGRRYPKAKQALVEHRDRITQEFSLNGGYFDLFVELASINSSLHDEDATFTLFERIHQRDPTLARQCFAVAKSLLVRKGKYAICLSYIREPQANFERIRQDWEWRRQSLGARNGETNGGHSVPPRSSNAQALKFVDGRFLSQTCELVEILVGTAHKPEAEEIRAQALTLLDYPRLKSALADAEKKVSKL